MACAAFLAFFFVFSSFAFAAEDFVAVAGVTQATGATTAQFEVSVLSGVPVDSGTGYTFGLASSAVLPSGVSVLVKPIGDKPVKASVSVSGASAGATLFIPIQVLRADGVSHTVTGIVSIPFVAQPSNTSVASASSASSGSGDFLLIANPSTVTVSSSRKFSFSVSVVSASSSSVKFSVPVSSGIVDVSVVPQSVSAGGVVAVSGAIDSRAGGGTYPVTVVGVDGFGVSHTVTVLVVVPGAVTPNSFTIPGNTSGTTVIASSSSSTTASVVAPVFVPPVIACKSPVFVVYGHDAASFDALAVSARLGDTVILRPDIAGPGAVPDATIALSVSKMRARGTRVFGLVDGKYGFGQLSQVAQDIAAYRDWYSLDGIGVYNVSVVSDAAAFFASVAQAIRLQGMQTMFVFSGYPDSAYYKNLIDYAVFEHASPALAAIVPPRAFFDYPAAQRINIVHGVSGVSSFADALTASPYVSGVAFSTGTILETSLVSASFSGLQAALDRSCIYAPIDPRAVASPDISLLHQLQAMVAALLRLLAVKSAGQ